jgi:hypothetical protein
MLLVAQQLLSMCLEEIHALQTMQIILSAKPFNMESSTLKCPNFLPFLMAYFCRKRIQSDSEALIIMFPSLCSADN